MLSQAVFDAEMIKLKEAKAKAKEALVELEAAEHRELNSKVSEMNHQWSIFCKSLDVEAYHRALEMWSKLDSEKHPQPMPTVETAKLYRQAFSMPELDKNDFAADQISLLEAAASNLNKDLDSHVLLAKFLMQAKSTSSELERQYGQYWTNPAHAVKAQKEAELLML